MAKKNSRKKRVREEDDDAREEREQLHPDIKRSILIVALIGVTILLILAAAGHAGPIGDAFHRWLQKLFGIGYYLLPITSFLVALSLFSAERRKFLSITTVGALFFVISGLGFIDIVSPGNGGLTGNLIGSLEEPFGAAAALVIMSTFLVASFLATINRPVNLSSIALSLKRKGNPIDDYEDSNDEEEEVEEDEEEVEDGKDDEEEIEEEEAPTKSIKERIVEMAKRPTAPSTPKVIPNYIAPPLSLLSSSVEKPTIGDLRANANIIKRTLESFGVSVEMGEINVGPSVTRYTLKPAEGIKLARIVGLNQDLALALAAHPIRIEAPIPGKSLVGIEVPNKAAALVRLGSLLHYDEFSKAEALTFALGRNVAGEPLFPDIGKMPHLLVAGATGSGKSIAMHSIILSLLFKNSPEMLKFILIDPKRVELSIYAGIPHLIAPVVTENKKAMGALRWVITEMDRRYEQLLEAGSRDIKSFNKSASEKLPYLIVVIDELADLMSTYGREVEGSIIRLAQMARATGIHLIVSTQRPSVEVITGLIKANITSRVALQVASQIDSRTILDTSGAEKLLGNGDLLFTSAEKSKPTRIQGSYITEDEIKKVVSFIKENNVRNVVETIEIQGTNGNDTAGEPSFENYGGNDDDDELYTEAVELVRSAGKASSSLLQRRFKVGYARAARLIDMMEERGVVGPGEGAKPREILEYE